MSNFKSELDEIMNDLIIGHNFDYARSAILSAVEAMGKRVIGGDIEVPRPLSDEESRARFYRASGQNFTRTRQRARLSQELGKERDDGQTANK